MEIDQEDIFEDDLDILEIIDYGFPRNINIRNDYFETLDNLTFFRRFRLYKNTVLRLLELVEADLEFPSDLNNSVSPINQLLTCLRFYASAGHLSTVADFAGISISTSSRIIKKVSEALARLHVNCIKMPLPNEFVREQTKFFRVASFPRVAALIDCTHVRIQSPGGNDGEIYRNRKSYFSINVQVLCNADLKIVNIVARWPGSAHDATIFNNSNIRACFERGDFPNSFILGDSGYPLKSYLLTPLANPQTRGQQLYNEAHIRTRNGVERLFGIWKRRFPVVAYGMRLKLQTVLTVISATAVLHNLAIEMNEPEPPPPEEINIEELNYLIEIGQIPQLPDAIGNNAYDLDIRNNLINNYFSN